MSLFKRLEKKKKIQAREKKKIRCLLIFGSLSEKRKERKEKERIYNFKNKLHTGEGRGGNRGGVLC
jgi:hypothetical protein